MMRRSKKRFLVMVLFFAACGKNPDLGPAPVPDLYSGVWLLSTIVESNANGDQAPPESYDRYNGLAYRFNGTRVFLADLANRKALCGSPSFSGDTSKLNLSASVECSAREYTVVTLNSAQLVIRRSEDGFNFKTLTFEKITDALFKEILEEWGIPQGE